MKKHLNKQTNQPINKTLASGLSRRHLRQLPRHQRQRAG